MLLVKTKIGQSAIHGSGLFADQFIQKGTPVWKFHSDFDQELSTDDLARMSESAREQTLQYAYISPATGKYVLCFDDARFLNHSDEPNLWQDFSDPEGIDTAARDIFLGEELTCNYFDYDQDAKRKLGL
ncbi:MAG: SET domain-containing protein [Patescibacteria group bacterium]